MSNTPHCVICGRFTSEHVKIRHTQYIIWVCKKGKGCNKKKRLEGEEIIPESKRTYGKDPDSGSSYCYIKR